SVDGGGSGGAASCAGAGGLGKNAASSGNGVPAAGASNPERSGRTPAAAAGRARNGSSASGQIGMPATRPIRSTPSSFSSGARADDAGSKSTPSASSVAGSHRPSVKGG